MIQMRRSLPPEFTMDKYNKNYEFSSLTKTMIIIRYMHMNHREWEYLGFNIEKLKRDNYRIPEYVRDFLMTILRTHG